MLWSRLFRLGGVGVFVLLTVIHAESGSNCTIVKYIPDIREWKSSYRTAFVNPGMGTCRAGWACGSRN